ncbi:MAG: acylphosphatase [Candidatus Buchananbacteria bacterium]|nr:acylphosphatase [Candidatus Buchananbacteria bacterium]
MPENARVLLKIHGRVQGVFFRDSAQKKAQALNLTGWVGNNSDGTVEIVAEGNKEKLQEFIDWCQQGSEAAQVSKIETDWQKSQAEFNDFLIQY